MSWHSRGRRSRWFAATGAAVLAALSLAGAVAASSPATGGSRVVVDVGHQVVLVPTVADKAAWDPNHDARLLGVSPTSLSTYDVDGCGWPNCNPASLGNTQNYPITPPGGKASTITVHFSSSDPYAFPETDVTFNGNSYAKWLGCCPFNANKITLGDHFHADGLAVNVTISWPPGIGFSGSGSDAYFTNSVNNNWAIYHNWNNIHFGALDMWDISEDSTTTFQFGSSFYTTQTHDSCLI